MEAICLTAGRSGERIDKFLSEELDSLSRSYIQKLVKDGEVRVNGNAVKANYKVNINDSIEVNNSRTGGTGYPSGGHPAGCPV